MFTPEELDLLYNAVASWNAYSGLSEGCDLGFEYLEEMQQLEEKLGKLVLEK